MVLGSTGSFGTGTSDFYSILIDPQGSIIWSKTFGGYGIDVGRSIAVSSAGILLVGFSNSHGAIGYNGYAILISDEGEIIWEESYGTENWDFFVKAVPLENGFILAGHRYGDDTLQGDAWVVRIDEAGGVVWSETFGGLFADKIHALIIGEDGDIYASLESIMGMDGSKASIWRIATETGESEQVFEMQGNSVITGLHKHDGVIAFCGYTELSGIMVLVGTLDYEGSVDLIIHTGPNDYFLSDIVDGEFGYIMTGHIQGSGVGGRDAFLMFVDFELGYIQGLTFGSEHDEASYAISRTTDGLIFAGYTDGYGPGVRAVHIVKTNMSGSTQGAPVISFFDPVSVPTHASATFSIHPNPVSSGSTLHVGPPTGRHIRTITLTDLSGRVLATERCTGCTQIVMPNLTAGMYQISLEFDDGQRSARSVVVE